MIDRLRLGGPAKVGWQGEQRQMYDRVVATPRLLRFYDARESLRYQLGHGDLLVMGGSCQRTCDHCVPKTSVPTGPQISIQFRTAGVR